MMNAFLVIAGVLAVALALAIGALLIFLRWITQVDDRLMENSQEPYGDVTFTGDYRTGVSIEHKREAAADEPVGDVVTLPDNWPGRARHG